jgi:lipopolysaccharide export system protein LptA
MKARLILLTIAFLTLITLLPAHPASAVNVTFDKTNSQLFISFNHQVQNNADHFIAAVTVTRGKKVIISQSLTYQDSKEGGEVCYKINDLKAGEKITVTATCSKVGKKSQTITIK